MENELQELKNDISVLFRYHLLLVRHSEAIEHKNCAVKQQDFNKAAEYRNQEVDLFASLVKISEEFESILKKYNSKPTDKVIATQLAMP